MADSTAVARVERAPLSASTAEEHSIAVQKASLLAKSTVVPSAYRGNPANVLVALEYAGRLGASVLAVMQNLDVIEGKPALRATFLIGTVNASQRFTPIRFRWQGTEGADDWGCRAVAKDRDSGEECIGPLITIGLAKAEGWYQKRGSKWQTIPELMLTYRAGAWWTRIYCPELALGLHTTDEIEDIGPSPRAHAQNVAAALAAPDPDEPAGPDYETVTNGGAEEGTVGAKDPKLANLYDRYLDAVERGGFATEPEYDAFRAKLAAEGKVSSANVDNWTAQDLRSAIAELAQEGATT